MFEAVAPATTGRWQVRSRSARPRHAPWQPGRAGTGGTGNLNLVPMALRAIAERERGGDPRFYGVAVAIFFCSICHAALCDGLQNLLFDPAGPGLMVS